MRPIHGKVTHTSAANAVVAGIGCVAELVHATWTDLTSNTAKLLHPQCQSVPGPCIKLKFSMASRWLSTRASGKGQLCQLLWGTLCGGPTLPLEP